ncbi:MAG: hypothetical protein ACD_73C00329G0001, partial [uncultured bacterium]
AGIVGENAARIAKGMGSRVLIFDKSVEKLKIIKKKITGIEIGGSQQMDMETAALEADLLIGAVLVPGAKAPKLIKQSTVERMKGGSVIVDVAVDQGGCVETSVITSHENPVVKRFSILHYGVPNMPGAVPVTATRALVNATTVYIQNLADLGFDDCIKKFPEMKGALNCFKGEIMLAALKNIL